AAPRAAAGRAARGTETVLVAEDDAALRAVVVRVLKRAGYEVLAAGDGEAALRLFKEHKERVALALLDVVMPCREGYEVYEAAAPLKPDLKVLFMSGYSQLDAQSAVRMGLPFIQKPFSPEALTLRVREALDA
ncbi:MAG: response regulator, partial [Elusimicrobia bacterium]|nr:response regulator [Elusimicrobiota bacterium]